MDTLFVVAGHARLLIASGVTGAVALTGMAIAKIDGSMGDFRRVKLAALSSRCTAPM